jgi:hypothetical protein
MQMCADDDVGFVFGTADKALSWADSVLARPDCKSQLLQAGPGGGKYSMQDIRDMAHTISACMQDIRPYGAGCLFRHIHGLPAPAHSFEALKVIVDRLAELEEGRDKKQFRLRALALAEMNGERKYIMSGRRMAVAKVAKEVGVSRTTLYSNPWTTLRQAAQRHVREMAGQADRQLTVMLQDKGVV